MLRMKPKTNQTRSSLLLFQSIRIGRIVQKYNVFSQANVCKNRVLIKKGLITATGLTLYTAVAHSRRPTVESLSSSDFKPYDDSVPILPYGFFQTEYFDQTSFLDSVESYLPIRTGHCFSLTLLWYLYEMGGKNLISELGDMERAISEKKSLNDTQKRLLDECVKIQKYQPDSCFFGCYVKKLNNNDFSNRFNQLLIRENLFSATRYYNKDEAIQSVIKRALNHPDLLIGISIKASKGGHIVGFKSHYANNKYYFKYFDSNRGTWTVDSVGEAKAFLSNSLDRCIEECFDSNYRTIRVTNFSFKEKNRFQFWNNPSCLGKRPLFKKEVPEEFKLNFSI
jgi:hypothetical protein